MAEELEQTPNPSEEPQNDDAIEQDDVEQQEEPADNLPPNQVAIEDAGTLKKKVTVTVPRERIDAKMNEMFGELSQTAQIPGFRVGRAPRRLIEKRFGREITGDVRNALIGDALREAMEGNDLETIGEPDLDLDKIELPDAGDMEFSFEVEVYPEFDLPELEGIEVTRPQADISDERLDEYLQQFRESRATYAESEDPAEKGDTVQASAIISGDDVEANEHPGLTLRVAPGQIEGLPLVELGNALAGKKAGDTAELTVKAPESHPNEAWRGKDLTVKINVSGVRKRQLPELNDEMAQTMGFENLDDMKDYVRGQLTQRMAVESQRAMRDQICNYLLEKVDIEVPEGVASRHAARTIQRQYINLLYQGVPRERIDENITQIQAEATEQARRDLKLQFILGKVIEEKDIEVGEDEVNARIAQMAVQYDRRPERLRQELASDGTLAQLHQSLAEEKALNVLLESAKVTEGAESAESGDSESK